MSDDRDIDTILNDLKESTSESRYGWCVNPREVITLSNYIDALRADLAAAVAKQQRAEAIADKLTEALKLAYNNNLLPLSFHAVMAELKQVKDKRNEQ